MNNRIVFEHDGRSKSTIIVDGKSYVLLGYNNKLTIKGNTLKGRGNEGFVNQFIKDCIWHVFDEVPELIRAEYEKWHERIENKEMTAEDVCKRENINMSLEVYRNKIAAGQSRIATYEAADNAERDYIKGDTIVTWIEEPSPVLKEYKTKPDVWKIPKNAVSYENIRLADNFNHNIYRHHYHSRLETSVKRFLVVLGLDGFKKMFPELSILKPDKIKLIPVLGLDRFVKEFLDFKWNEKAIKKLPEKEYKNFENKIKNGILSKEYLTLIKTNK